MRVLLLTGPGGDAQGWGDLDVTAVGRRGGRRPSGHPARIAFVETEAEFLTVVDQGGFDIVWSALYHITPNERVHRDERRGACGWPTCSTAGASPTSGPTARR